VEVLGLCFERSWHEIVQVQFGWALSKCGLTFPEKRIVKKKPNAGPGSRARTCMACAAATKPPRTAREIGLGGER